VLAYGNGDAYERYSKFIPWAAKLLASQ